MELTKLCAILYHKMKAKLVYRSKLIYPDRAIREMVIWQLPKADDDRRHGLKYRLYYGDEDGKCLVRYDNEKGKGNHRHYCDKEESYHFVDVATLINDFQTDIDRLRESNNHE